MARGKILPMRVMTPVEMLDAYRESHRHLGVDLCIKDRFGDTRCGLCKMYDRWTGAPKTSAARKPK
jgi:hypothetical protein